ncbi:MAG: FUN14 domain-containing protein [Candidatus Nitrosopolaris sp.]
MGALVGYSIKVVRVVAIIIGLFVAASAYLEYHGIISVDSLNRLTSSIAESPYMDSNHDNSYINVGAGHTAASVSDFIPLTSSISFILGIRG